MGDERLTSAARTGCAGPGGTVAIIAATALIVLVVLASGPVGPRELAVAMGVVAAAVAGAITVTRRARRGRENAES